MKLTNKIALISTLGCLALVGTGFAAYIYTDGNTKATAANEMTISATAKTVNHGTITTVVATGTGITFDSEKNGNKQVLDSNGHLISVATWNAASAISATWDPADGVDTTSSTGKTWTVTLTSNVYFHFEAATMSGTWTSGNAITKPTIVVDHPSDPQTPAAYDSMVTALSSVQIVFTFTVA
jgi:hypothetical protein